jgi:myo-inositol-1(or 4)-monophosphatase
VIAKPGPTPELLLAAERAVSAGTRMLEQGRSHVGALIAKGDRDFATAVDVAIEEAIKGMLAEQAPGVSFVGEEKGGASLDEGALWVLDPIDGTVNFARGSPLCAISLALVEDGQPILAVVDLPLLGERYVAARGGGAYLNGRAIRMSQTDGLEEAVVGIADFAVGSRAGSENPVHLALMRILSTRALRIRVHGSEAVDLAWLASGRLDATVMLSNLPWDVSGGVLLVREAGGVVYDGRGSPHSPRSEYTVASTPALREPLVHVLEEASDGARPDREAPP